MTSGREITTPPDFSVVPTTTTMFSATTPENTPLAYHASTSTNPNPVISPTFVEANYETLESLLRDRRRQMRNNDLRTELEYFSEDYDEEREMEPRPGPARAVTPPLRAASPRVRRRRERVVGFEETQNRGESRVLSNNVGGNLPPNGTFLSHNAQPFIPTNLNVPNGRMPMHVYPPPTTCKFCQWTAHGLPSTNSDGKPLYRGKLRQPPTRRARTIDLHKRPFPNPLGPVTPFVRWIEIYPLLDGLKMPSHIGSYDGKGNPNNFLHLFEGSIRMQKWLMPVACHMFTYTLKDSARIWWNSKKAGSILDHEDLKRENKSTRDFIAIYTDDTLQILGLYEDQRISTFIHGLRTRSLVEHISTDLPLTYKGRIEKTYTWVEAREVATNGASSDRRDSFERPKKSSWDNNRGQKNKNRFSPYRGPNHGLLSNLSKSPREILATD
nr:hypothetical protein [Tanacetum cinerariifolium]